jgi:DNA-binding transcriptional regulator YdaS (Cro superfamily)
MKPKGFDKNKTKWFNCGMDLKSFLSPMDAEARDQFAVRCGTTRGHLQNVMYGLKTCATYLAVHIERESGGVVRRWELRPDWDKHWPELIGQDGAPAVPCAPATETVVVLGA